MGVQGSSMRRLKEMGFDPQRYLGVVTSGELAYQGLMTPRTQEPYSQIKGHKYAAHVHGVQGHGAQELTPTLH